MYYGMAAPQGHPPYSFPKHAIGSYCKECRAYHKAPSELSEFQLQYLAGFFDAEGTAYKPISNPTSFNQASSYVSIPNTNKKVVDVIYEWLKFGRVSQRFFSPNTIRFSHKPIYVWYNNSILTNQLLLALLPYLRVKADRASQLTSMHQQRKPMTYAYVAGFFDGEGSVIAYFNKKYKAHHDHYALTLTQKDHDVLKEIQAFVGFGNLYVDRKGIGRLKFAHHTEQQKFIEGVLPFSIVKKKKLQQAINFVTSRDWDEFHQRGKRLDGKAISVDYELGKLSGRDLAEKYHVSLATIQRKLREIGVTVRPVGTNQTFRLLGNLSKRED